MINKEELAASITTFDREKVSTTGEVLKGQVRYNYKGLPFKDLDDGLTCALEFDGTKGKVYKIKAERGGHLYDPNVKDGGRDYGLDKIDRTTGQLRFQLKAVEEKSFRHYLKFLQTGYDSFLTKAERE